MHGSLAWAGHRCRRSWWKFLGGNAGSIHQECSPEQIQLRTTEEREADRFLVRDLRAAAVRLYPRVGGSGKTQKQFMDTQEDLVEP